MYEYLLPIGSVVKLKNAKKPLMVFGLLQNNPMIPNKSFEYISVPYPEGHFDVRLHIGFNHDDIENIIFRGYEDEAQLAFKEMLELSSQIDVSNDKTIH